MVTMNYTDPTPDAYAEMDATAWENEFLWSEDGSSATFSTNALEFGADATDATGDVTMVICFVTAPESLAVQIGDQSSNVSNVACVTREDLLPEPGDTTLPGDGEPSE